MKFSQTRKKSCSLLWVTESCCYRAGWPPSSPSAHHRAHKNKSHSRHRAIKWHENVASFGVLIHTKLSASQQNRSIKLAKKIRACCSIEKFNCKKRTVESASYLFFFRCGTSTLKRVKWVRIALKMMLMMMGIWWWHCFRKKKLDKTMMKNQRNHFFCLFFCVQLFNPSRRRLCFFQF